MLQRSKHNQREIVNAVIFAAGLGSRLSFQLINVYQHKSLLPLGNKTIIEHLIDRLLQITNLNKIIIITGYHHRAFLFLLKRYQCLELVQNACFAKHNSGCALKLIQTILLTSDRLFLLTGDMICYDNPFLNVPHGNWMSAVTKNVHHNWELAYWCNPQQRIFDVRIVNHGCYHCLGEFSVLNRQWSHALYQYLLNVQPEALAHWSVYQVLLKAAYTYSVPIYRYLMDFAGPSDIDDDNDYRIAHHFFLNRQNKT